MTRGLTVCLLLAAAAAAPARDEVPLDKLTPAQVHARLEKVMAAPPAKARLDDVLKAIPAKVEVDAKAVEFKDADGKVATVFVPGRTMLVWRYKSAAPLDPAQDKRVTELMQQVLAEAMNQDRDAAGKTLVTTDDWMALSKQVVIVRLTPGMPPPAGNTIPTITLITDKQVTAGDTARVRFTIGDAQTPAADLRVTSVSSAPGLLPPAHQSITPVSPDGAVRELAMVTTRSQPGMVRVTVTVTDAGGLSATRAFRLVIDPSSESGSGGRTASGPVAQGWYGNVGPGYGSAFPVAVPYPCAVVYPVVVGGQGFGAHCGRRCGWCGGGAAVIVEVAVVRGPCYQPVASAPSYASPARAAATRPAPAPVAAQVAEPPVDRVELLKGKRAEDWAGLYDAGFRAYWAGRYADAVEYSAAAADLSDDPRAWYYLGLAQGVLGDADAARGAIRYAAALVQAEPRFDRDVGDALSRVQGVERDRLNQLQAGVRTEALARHALTARPNLRRLARSEPTLVGADPR